MPLGTAGSASLRLTFFTEILSKVRQEFAQVGPRMGAGGARPAALGNRGRPCPPRGFLGGAEIWG